MNSKKGNRQQNNMQKPPQPPQVHFNGSQSNKSLADDVPPEFRELASSLDQKQQKIDSNYSSIPKGQEMFKNEFKGTNTQRLNEIQLRFQKEIGSLEAQLKNVQAELKSKENSERELERLKEQMKNKESTTNSQQVRLQEQLIELMKGYQQQIAYLTKMRDQSATQTFDRPGSNRSIGGKTNTRGAELSNYEKMLFSGPSKPPVPSYGNSNVIVDFNNPTDKPFVKVNQQPEGGNLDINSNHNFIDLNKSASLNAESKMVPVVGKSPSKIQENNKPRDYIPPQSLEGTGNLGGTSGSTNRRLNKELDEIEKMNILNEQEFPGSLKGTVNLDNNEMQQIQMNQSIPEDVESLRNTSQFENVPIDSIENNNPNQDLNNSSTFKLNNRELSDAEMAKSSMKIEKFEGFPEIPEYEGIQKDYIATLKSQESNPDGDHLLGDPLEGTAGTAGTGKSIDFEELQKKLTEKTSVSPFKPKEEDYQPERKKWGKPQDIQIETKEDKIAAIHKDMDGIDDLLEKFDPAKNENVPIYESEPDNFNNMYNDENLNSDKYRPNMECILEQSNEYTKSGDKDLLSLSEKKMIQEELLKARRNNDN